MIPLDSRDGEIWLDGALVPWRDGRLHVLSHGLHYATAAFEGIRVYDGEPFELDAHVARLAFSCATAGIRLPWDAAGVAAEIRRYVARCGHGDAYLRPIAWRGSEELGIVGDAASGHLALACWPWSGPHEARAAQGIAVARGPWRRPRPDAWPLQAKLSGLYSIGSMNARHVKAAGFDDALVLEPEGEGIAELTGANLFFVERAGLVTPGTTYALDGITRRTVLRLAEALGIPVRIGAVVLGDVPRFAGAFATGTAYELLPLNRIDDHAYDLGASAFRDVFAPIAAAFARATRASTPQ